MENPMKKMFLISAIIALIASPSLQCANGQEELNFYPPKPTWSDIPKGILDAITFGFGPYGKLYRDLFWAEIIDALKASLTRNQKDKLLHQYLWQHKDFIRHKNQDLKTLDQLQTEYLCMWKAPGQRDYQKLSQEKDRYFETQKRIEDHYNTMIRLLTELTKTPEKTRSYIFYTYNENRKKLSRHYAYQKEFGSYPQIANDIRKFINGYSYYTHSVQTLAPLEELLKD